MQDETTLIISKDKTLIIKGFAILFMIAHHCLIKEFYISVPEFLYNPIAIRLQIGSKMCVGLFTFFVGYGCFYAKSIDLLYISRHVWRLLKPYWSILFLTLLIIIITYSKNENSQHVKWGYSLTC